MILKSYDVSVRIPMTAAARNAGATGRTYWWAYAGRVNAKSKRHACALMRKGEWAALEDCCPELFDAPYWNT